MRLPVRALASRIRQLPFRFLLVLALWGTMGQRVAAQSPWKEDPVLSRHIVYQVVQGYYGFLWVSTNNGIYRYDGYQAVPLSQFLPKQVSLPTAPYQMALGRKGELWLLGEQGLFRYLYMKQRLLAISLSSPYEKVLAVDTTHNCLWTSQGEYTIAAIDLKLGRVVRGSRHRFQRQIDWITVAANGDVWVVTGDKLITCITAEHQIHQYRGPAHRPIYPLLGTHPQQFFSTCAQYAAQPNGRLYEVYRWLPSRFGAYTEESLFGPQVQTGNEKWVFGNHLVHIKRAADGGQPVGASVEVLKFSNTAGYQAAPNYYLFSDRTGVEWGFSPLIRGCYKRSFITNIQALPSAQHDYYSTRAMARLSSGQLLVSSYTSMMSQPAGQPTSSLQQEPMGIPNNPNVLVVNDFLNIPTRPHHLLAAVENAGIAVLNSRTWQVRYLAGVTDPLQTTDLAYGPDGRAWAASQRGLLWVDTARLRLHYYQLPHLTIQPRNIRALAFDQAGYLWLANAQGLTRLATHTGQSKHFSQELAASSHLPTNEILSLHPSGTRMWVGTRDQGLLLIDPKQGVVRQVTTTEGLPDNTVCSLLADKQGSLWLGTYAGVVRYQPSTKSTAVFTTDNGLTDNECNYQSAFRDTNGDLYFGSVKGVTRILPQQLLGRQSLQRRLVISQIVRYPAGDTIAHVSYSGQWKKQTLHLTDDDQAAVQVALTDYLAPESTRYRYRLQGLADTTWHYFSSHRLVRLFNLPVGDYTLVFQGTAANGFAAINSVSIPVEVRRTWWKYPALWVIAGLLVVITAAAYSYRSHRHHQQQQQLLRQQLAYDLHDELGSLLFRASLQAELLKEENLTSRVASHLLSDLRAVSHAMHDIVWGIDPESNRLGDLVARMQDYLDQTANPTNRRIELQAAHLQLDKPLTTFLRQHIYAIFKEAVTNSLRHAQHSTFLTVSLTQQRQQLILSIRDDGQPMQLGRQGGIGLRSMRQRAQDLAGHLVVTTLPEGGVLVQLAVLLQS